ncbi:type-1 angiotensin ii receptor [Plakobranchus ocellatus]|uniref:Type-1 angiotensin ii receptor n=1 Tax=Plakobranchus ocellatus TaxID=259542 RepID=A0AAV4CZX3_9GAST|nr:type-1 angiotensin ii receptor [Plakobranchus ocellatus]
MTEQTTDLYINASGSSAITLKTTSHPSFGTGSQLDKLMIYPIVPIMFFSNLGLITNSLNVAVFIKMGFKETTNISMLSLAVSDFLSCLLGLWTYLCLIPEFRNIPNLPFEPTEIASETGTALRPYVTRTGAFITAFITLERCLCVVLPMKVKRIITIPVTCVTMIVIYVITLLPYSVHPVFTTIGWKYYPHLNKTLIGAVPTNNKVAPIFLIIIRYLVGFIFLLLAIIIILVCTLFLVITLAKSLRWRNSMRKQTQLNASSGQTSSQKPSESRKENRLIKMVVVIATLFIVSHLPGTILIFVLPVAEDYAEKNVNDPFTILQISFIFAFELVNNSVNFFVYYLIGTKFRLAFRQMVGLKEKNST